MKKYFLIMLCISSLLKVTGQKFHISGFDCVTPGIAYEYSFNAGWDSSSSIQVCITGGVISSNNSNCQTASGLRSVTVIWQDNVPKGKIVVNYPGGQMAKNINIQPYLNGGLIDTATQTQYVNVKAVPAEIRCSSFKGGACNPDIYYQWQQSTDFLNWKDITGATDKTLKFSTALKEALFFRRKITDKNSGTIAYSNEAVIYQAIN